jgi:hypothetical protein
MVRGNQLVRLGTVSEVWGDKEETALEQLIVTRGSPTR